jgi:hypothetical protein
VCTDATLSGVGAPVVVSSADVEGRARAVTVRDQQTHLV